MDGVFGSKTKEAVETFQKSEGLLVDGIVGPQTWRKLFL
ncbi:peptidoglycan-binding domain-containing protein [Shimazuella kribbensis]|nr:peptidoglycan-binding domain-containing protein [Shimazuella kribbensis]